MHCAWFCLVFCFAVYLPAILVQCGQVKPYPNSGVGTTWAAGAGAPFIFWCKFKIWRRLVTIIYKSHILFNYSAVYTVCSNDGHASYTSQKSPVSSLLTSEARQLTASAARASIGFASYSRTSYSVPTPLFSRAPLYQNIFLRHCPRAQDAHTKFVLALGLLVNIQFITCKLELT